MSFAKASRFLSNGQSHLWSKVWWLRVLLSIGVANTLFVRQNSPWIQDSSSGEHPPGSTFENNTSPPPGTFSASHLFSWILQSGKLTENNRYVQLVVHLGITGSRASRRAPRAIPEETRRLQVLPTVPVWQLKPVHQLRLRLATRVVCCDFKFRDSVLNSCLCWRLLPPAPHPPSSSSVVRVVCVLSYPPLLSCFYLPFPYVSPATFRDQKPGRIRPESLISLPFNRHQHLNKNRVDRILWERRTYFLVNAHGKLLFSFVFCFLFGLRVAGCVMWM